MNVLVTGHEGYIGSVLTPMLVAAGHHVVGLDSGLFADCTFGEQPIAVPALQLDVRDIQLADLAGFDAVIHLAALSNDPLGNLDEGLTYEINHRASVRLASLAKEAGVPRFLFSSSCSIYGAAGEDVLTEDAAFNPVTAYGRSKVMVEQDVAKLASPSFSPTFLRNATAYGSSPRLRVDVAVNNLVGFGYTTGEVLIMSDGTPWRPLVHVRDICQAFIAALEAPRELVHNQAFNVGSTSENYQIGEVAELVEATIPGTHIRYAEHGGPDLRCYRVDCGKLARTFASFHPQWTVARGVQELVGDYTSTGLTREQFFGTSYLRLNHLKGLLASGELDAALRWRRIPGPPRHVEWVTGGPLVEVRE